MSEQAREAIAGREWWHTIEVAPGVVTHGWWDLRPTAARLPWPGPLDGLRCLDIGTMDGFWAFELERRGAAEVLAVDLVDMARHDMPVSERGRRSGEYGARERFQLAAGLLGSRAEFRDLSVYELSPDLVGEFDVIVMGFVLQMLRDPLRGLEAVRTVCRGHLLLLDTVSLPLSLVPAPVARLDGRRDGFEWFVFNPRGLARACRLAGFEVEEVSPILSDGAGPAVGTVSVSRRTRTLHRLGLRGRSTAIRARRAG